MPGVYAPGRAIVALLVLLPFVGLLIGTLSSIASQAYGAVNAVYSSVNWSALGGVAEPAARLMGVYGFLALLLASPLGIAILLALSLVKEGVERG